eukprot:4935422-Karenia_brevis.AAC.1
MSSVPPVPNPSVPDAGAADPSSADYLCTSNSPRELSLGRQLTKVSALMPASTRHRRPAKAVHKDIDGS